MIAELGLAALWLATALAGLQLLGGVLGQRDSGAELASLVRPAAVMQALLCAFSFGMLLLLFARTDLSVALVVQHSHSEKPMIFKIAGTWGNHEGSMLLWITVMALAGGLIALAERRRERGRRK
jgi:cytochrome c-type biogenesis protein CcmF